MAHSPSRVYATLLPSGEDVHGHGNESIFHHGANQNSLHPQSNVRVVQVTGCAELSCLPDRATVVITVKNSKENVNDVTNSVSRRLDYILQTVRQNDVKVKMTFLCFHIFLIFELMSLRVSLTFLFLWCRLT